MDATRKKAVRSQKQIRSILKESETSLLKVATLFNQVKELEEGADTAKYGDEEAESSEDEYIRSLLSHKQHLQGQHVLSSKDRSAERSTNNDRSSGPHAAADQKENLEFQPALRKGAAPETKEEADSRFDREEALLDDVLGAFGRLDPDRSQNLSQDPGQETANRPRELANAELLHQASATSISKPSTS